MIDTKELLRAITPPLAWQLLRRLRRGGSGNQWSGNYENWAEAISHSSSYDAQAILDKVLKATLEVEAGRAACERDGCTFAETSYSWPLLSSLLWIFAKEKRLSLLDIGGSLGSTWRQNHRFLDSLSPIEWMIVEQSVFVQVGRERFQRLPVSFHNTVAECIDRSPNAALFSASLHYMEQPWSLLDEVTDSSCNYLIFDLTPVAPAIRDRLTIQTVDPRIYAASYPCWIFSRPQLESKLKGKWTLLESWRSIPEIFPDFEMRGYLFARRTN